MSVQSLLLSDPNHSFFVNLVLKQLNTTRTQAVKLILETKRKCDLLWDIAIQKDERERKIST